jgi:putative MFS transporter
LAGPLTRVRRGFLQPQHWKVFTYANAGVFVDGYILSSVGLALITLGPQFHLDPVSTGWVGAATLLGIFAGAPIFGHLTDRHGRRILMIADLCAFVVIAIAQVFATNALELTVLRFLLGVTIGADYPIAAAIITEFMPERVRGAALCAVEAVWFVGAAVAYVAGYALLSTGPNSWKWILASPAVFALAGLLMRASAPESPMWLRARDAGDISALSLSTVFAGPFRKMLTFVSVMWFLQVVPLFAVYTYAPAVLSALGLGDQRSPAGSVAITAAFAVGSFLSILLVERWGRRPLCIAGFATGVVAFAFLPFVNAVGVVACFLLYAVGIGAASGLELVYPNELFPTHVRGTATGFAAAFSRIGAFAGTFALPMALVKFGTTPVMLTACVLSALGLVISWVWAPETKGRQIA